MLTTEQKKEIVDTAKRMYKKARERRISEGDPWCDKLTDDNYLKDGCYNIANCVYYLAKEYFHVPDTANEILGGEISFANYTTSHFINKVYGNYIDASIEQFNNHQSQPGFSPYESYGEIYKGMMKIEACSEVIEYEINELQCEKLIEDLRILLNKRYPNKVNEVKKESIFSRIYLQFSKWHTKR